MEPMATVADNTLNSNVKLDGKHSHSSTQSSFSPSSSEAFVTRSTHSSKWCFAGEHCLEFLHSGLHRQWLLCDPYEHLDSRLEIWGIIMACRIDAYGMTYFVSWKLTPNGGRTGSDWPSSNFSLGSSGSSSSSSSSSSASSSPSSEGSSLESSWLSVLSYVGLAFVLHRLNISWRIGVIDRMS